MRVFLDDVRIPPLFDQDGKEYHWDMVCRSAEQLLALIETGKVTFIAFDHDLGGILDGADVAKRILVLARTNMIPKIDYSIHSANYWGANEIDDLMKEAHACWAKHLQEQEISAMREKLKTNLPKPIKAFYSEKGRLGDLKIEVAPTCDLILVTAAPKMGTGGINDRWAKLNSGWEKLG